MLQLLLLIEKAIYWDWEYVRHLWRFSCASLASVWLRWWPSPCWVY